MLLWRREHNVVIDATAHRKKWRDYAKEIIPDLLEVYTQCPIEVCMKRETRRHKGTVMEQLYQKALERVRTGQKIKGLGQVPGVDVPYEESDNPAITVDTDQHSPQESARLILEELQNRNLLPTSARESTE
jgi:adenylylsulfate kinase